ncbi:PfkB family carbohydrate kinase [Acerihabitans sp. TG2]|uniref:PfkB family carbohydrate kinase n=1 Tax=Acerihabitans sp. TG2 TaxID=3096008 RepID=UPI002B22F212|nr:PfkB family carbohydrate kinase [Acerihabitans sp. TG2]MEA9391865.1 PfkB family carbohydrate kinase [Acerihabitans sp. TG2]
MKVIGIGDNVVDQYHHIQTRYPGGNALNFSVYATLLGCPSAYLGVFGDDSAAEQVKTTLQRLGVDASRCRQVSGENGCASLTIEQGERRFLGSNQGGVSRFTSMDFVLDDLDYLRSFALIHTGSYGYLDAQLPALYRLGLPLSYDFSDDFLLATALALCPYLDFAFFSCAEQTPERSRDILSQAVAAGAGCAVATRGAQPALLYDGRHWYEQRPRQVVPVDTLGAGDAFITAFLLGYFDLSTQVIAMAEDRLQPMSISNTAAPDADRIVASLAMAADFAADICLQDGSFGCGERY